VLAELISQAKAEDDLAWNQKQGSVLDFTHRLIAQRPGVFNDPNLADLSPAAKARLPRGLQIGRLGWK
jgi:hypothetical protein